MGGSLGVVRPLPGATGMGAETLIKWMFFDSCFRWEGGQCQAFAEVRLLDVTLSCANCVSSIVSEIGRLLDCRRFWQVPHTFQGRKMSTLEVGPVFQTLRLANLQTSFTSLFQNIYFLYHADDGFCRSPWSPSTWSFFPKIWCRRPTMILLGDYCGMCNAQGMRTLWSLIEQFDRLSC